MLGLAVLGQILLGGAVRTIDADPDVLALAAVICRADDGGARGAPEPRHHHVPECAVCPLCQAHAVTAPVLAAPPALPRPRVLARRHPAAPPAARAPPVVALVHAYPRGPPSLRS
jgi:hypothetical protein